MKEDCTYFDKHTSFRGSISTPDELVVEGNVRGEVEAARQVTILNGAEVRGPIRTAKILLQEGAYHLGALSLSDRPDAISLSDLHRLRPARYATSPPAASPAPARKNEKNATETPAAEKEEPVPAGFDGDSDPSDRLW